MRLVWCFFFHLCGVAELKSHANHFFLCSSQNSACRQGFPYILGIVTGEVSVAAVAVLHMHMIHVPTLHLHVVIHRFGLGNFA
jgi:hypothetical protein